MVSSDFWSQSKIDIHITKPMQISNIKITNKNLPGDSKYEKKNLWNQDTNLTFKKQRIRNMLRWYSTSSKQKPGARHIQAPNEKCHSHYELTTRNSQTRIKNKTTKTIIYKTMRMIFMRREKYQISTKGAIELWKSVFIQKCIKNIRKIHWIENPTKIVIWYNNQGIQDSNAKRPANLKRNICFFF